MATNPIAVFMIGVQGSGKSTLSRNKFPEFIRISSDDYIEKKAKDTGKSYQEIFIDSIPQATKYMYEMLDDAIKNRLDIVWDQPNASKSSRAAKIKKMINAGYVIMAAFMTIDTETIHHRNYQRMAETGKSVPKAVIDNTAAMLEPPEFSEGFNHIFHVDKDGNMIKIGDGNI